MTKSPVSRIFTRRHFESKLVATLFVIYSLMVEGFSPRNWKSRALFVQHRHPLELFVSNKEENEKSGRSYNLISVEEADRILQQERLEHEEELKTLKEKLAIQCEQLREFDGPIPEVQFLLDGEESTIREDVDNDRIDDKFFSSPYATTMNEDDYREQHQNSHDAAERRTIEIALRNMDEENEELENEFKNQEESYQNYIEEIQEQINDARERSECIREELKIEHSFFERASAEMEDVLNQERSKVRELEERLLIARREQEILEEAEIAAHHREQEIKAQQELEEQQHRIEIEREERERHQQLQKEDERMHEEDLLREHQELTELETNQAEFNKVYFDVFSGDRIEGPQTSNYAPGITLEQAQQKPQRFDSSYGQQEYEHHNGSIPPEAQYPPDLEPFYDAESGRPAASTTVAQTSINPPKAKRECRSNSHAHGIFMNFNDILM